MKGKKSRTWESLTLSQLVSDILSSYRISYEVPADPFIFSRIVQSAMSDWELLVTTCGRLGYRMSMNGTHLRIYDPFHALHRSSEYVVLESVKGASLDPSYKPGRIQRFETTVGAVTTAGTNNDVNVSFIDHEGQIETVGPREGFASDYGRFFTSRFTDQTTINADHYDMAVRLAEAERRKSMPFHASVWTTGVPNPAPGSVVDISGYSTESDGFWLVEATTHTFVRSMYLTEMDISRDSTGADPARLSRAIPKVTQPLPILLRGTWAASKEYSLVY
jgi:phage protein D